MNTDPRDTPAALLCLLHGHWWINVTYDVQPTTFYWCRDCDIPMVTLRGLIADGELERARMVDIE